MRRFKLKRAFSLAGTFCLAVSGVFAASLPNDSSADPRVFEQTRSVGAWDYMSSHGPKGPVVHIGIMDTGVEFTHPDLSGQEAAQGLSHDFVGDNAQFPDTSPGGHGTGMAGFAVARTDDGQFVASPAGFQYWLGSIKAVSLRWTNGATFEPQKVRDALDYAKVKNATGEANFTSLVFAYGINDDNREATKQAVIAVAPCVIFAPPHGMIGSLASDPEVHNVCTITSLDESGEDFDPKSGASIDATLALPGGVLHQLVPMVGPGGFSSGVITTGGVSQGIAIAASCHSIVCQWNSHTADPLQALEAIKWTAVWFRAGEGHVLGKVNLAAAVQFDPNGPLITSVTLGSNQKKFTLKGSNLDGGELKVMLNDINITEATKSSSPSKLVLKSGLIRKSLMSGRNTVELRTQDGTTVSNVWVFTL